MYCGTVGNNLNNDHQSWLLSFLHQDGKHPHLPLLPIITPKLSHHVKLQQNIASPCCWALWFQKKRSKHGWNIKVGKLLCVLSLTAFIRENNYSESCSTKIGGKITNGCVLLTLDTSFKSCICCSTSKFLKRSPSSSTFGAS